MSYNNYLEVGSVLLIPRNTKKRPREILTDTLLVAIDPKLTFSYDDRQLVYFPVRRPVSVERLASFFGVTPREVSLWNTLDAEATLQRGMSLRLYVPDTFDFSTALLAKPSQIQVVDPTTDLGEELLSTLQGDKNDVFDTLNIRLKEGKVYARSRETEST